MIDDKKKYIRKNNKDGGLVDVLKIEDNFVFARRKYPRSVGWALFYVSKEVWDEEYEEYNKNRIQETIWINLYEDRCESWHSKLSCDYSAKPDRLACVEVKIDCMKGDGL